MSYAGASNACERHWVWMRMSWRRQGTAPSTKTILRKRDVRPWTTGMDGTVGGGLSPETVSVFGFRPFPKRGGAATNDRIDALREDDLSGCAFSSSPCPDCPSGFRSRFPSHRRRGVFSPRNRRMGLLSVDTERLPAHHAPSGRPPQDSRFPETSREGFPRGHKKTGGDRNVF